MEDIVVQDRFLLCVYMYTSLDEKASASQTPIFLGC